MVKKCKGVLAVKTLVKEKQDIRAAQQNLGPKAKILYGAFLYVNIN